MDPRETIAERMDHLLSEQIGLGINLRRMLREERYARDVLLVCEALKDTEGPALARDYAQASAPQARRPPAPARISEPMPLDPAKAWINEADLGLSRSPSTRAKAAWYSPSRWLRRSDDG